ncbi:HYR domain-containing protein [Deinococcus koreensis]|uniref:HYR domain-containing protein n=1 Tax=Deinococcus koreensis TaxID=2054903 RepID=A0A2K3UU76_9DEIO|nr:HYR domain-containing protein [Deinococcus koreensis]PNY80085.1 hypothetical protein CVO96_00800 [Deinococcus koreensis]
MKRGKLLLPVLTMLALAGCSQSGTPTATTPASAPTAAGRPNIKPLSAGTGDATVGGTQTATVTLSGCANTTIDRTVRYRITGKQDGTATIKFPKGYIYSGGIWIASPPVNLTNASTYQVFTVAPRPTASDAAQNIDVTLTLTIGSHVTANASADVSVAPADISNTNATGSKLTIATNAYAVIGTSITACAPPVANNTAPELTVPMGMMLEATAASTPVTFAPAPTAFDTEDAALNLPLTISCTPATGSGFAVGTTTVSCSVTDSGKRLNGSADSAGPKTTTLSFPVTVTDTTRPLVTVPANISIEATKPQGADVTFAPATATDLASGALTPTCDKASGATFPVGVTTVTCSATDGAGNTGTGTFTVTVTDTAKPVLATHLDVTAEATSASGALVTFTNPTATDIVDTTPTVSCAPVSGGTFALGSTAVSCTATDDAGNSSSSIFNVIVRDTTAPALAPHGAVTAEATSSAGATVTYTSPAASDAVDATPTVSCTPASGSTFALGAHTVSCTATDDAGNHSSSTFSVTVADSTAPVLAAHANITAEATSAAGAVVTFTNPTATDAVSTPNVSCTPASGSTFALGTNTVTCTATDGGGNEATGSFTITVQDKTPPTLHLPSNLTLEATSPAGAMATFSATASDLVSGNVAVSCEPVSGTTLAVGSTTTVECSATDGGGNKATGSFTIAVVDTTKPVLTLSDDLIREATGPMGAAVTFNTSASDLVSGNVSVSCNKTSGATFALGTTPVTCSATDDAGNTASGSFDVTVQDSTKPDLTLSDNLIKEATGPAGAVVTFSNTATDLVDLTVTVVCTPISGSTFALGTERVDCSATDDAGNKATGSFTVEVRDTTAPHLTVPTNLTEEATGPSGAVVTFITSATDLVDGPVAVSCTPASGGTFVLGDTTVNCSATDDAGNKASGSFKVIVRDTTPPSLSLSGNLSAEATGPGGAYVSFTNTAHDLVDGSVTVTCKLGTTTISSSHTFALGTTTVDCSATDAHGNPASGSFNVVIEDRTAPSLRLPAAISLEGDTLGGRNVSFTPSATDLVDGPVAVSCDKASGSLFPVGTTTVTCLAKDGRTPANSATGSFTVTVQDATNPVLTLPGNLTAEATGPGGAAVNFSTSATDLVSGTVSVSCDKASGATFPLGTTTVTCSATDGAGNKATGSFEVKVQDTTAPVLAAHANVTAFATANGVATVTYTNPTATDAISTPTVSCTPASSSPFSVGTKVVTCTATDAAGNASTSTFNVIVAYNFTGFFQPIDMGNVYNTVKVGSAVPVKFKLGGNQGLSIFAPGFPNATSVNCSTSTLDDIEELSAATVSGLSYDATSGQYNYVWKTSSAFKAGSCYQLNVKFIDGNTQSALFKFK